MFLTFKLKDELCGTIYSEKTIMDIREINGEIKCGFGNYITGTLSNNLLPQTSTEAIFRETYENNNDNNLFFKSKVYYQENNYIVLKYPDNNTTFYNLEYHLISEDEYNNREVINISCINIPFKYKTLSEFTQVHLKDYFYQDNFLYEDITFKDIIDLLDYLDIEKKSKINYYEKDLNNFMLNNKLDFKSFSFYVIDKDSLDFSDFNDFYVETYLKNTIIGINDNNSIIISNYIEL